MYDSSKAAGFNAVEGDDEGVSGYAAFLDCMEAAQALLDDTLTEDENTAAVSAAETACYDTSYRGTAMASFFFFDKIEGENEVEDENLMKGTFLDAYM